MDPFVLLSIVFLRSSLLFATSHFCLMPPSHTHTHTHTQQKEVRANSSIERCAAKTKNKNVKNCIAKIDPTQQKCAMRPKGQITYTHTHARQIKKKKIATHNTQHTTHNKHPDSHDRTNWSLLEWMALWRSNCSTLFYPCFVLFCLFVWACLSLRKCWLCHVLTFLNSFLWCFAPQWRAIQENTPHFPQAILVVGLKQQFYFFKKIDIGTNESLSVTPSNNQSVERVSSSFWCVCCCTWRPLKDAAPWHVTAMSFAIGTEGTSCSCSLSREENKCNHQNKRIRPRVRKKWWAMKIKRQRLTRDKNNTTTQSNCVFISLSLSLSLFQKQNVWAYNQKRFHKTKKEIGNKTKTTRQSNSNNVTAENVETHLPNSAQSSLAVAAALVPATVLLDRRCCYLQQQTNKQWEGMKNEESPSHDSNTMCVVGCDILQTYYWCSRDVEILAIKSSRKTL